MSFMPIAKPEPTPATSIVVHDARKVVTHFRVLDHCIPVTTDCRSQIRLASKGFSLSPSSKWIPEVKATELFVCRGAFASHKWALKVELYELLEQSKIATHFQVCQSALDGIPPGRLGLWHCLVRFLSLGLFFHF
jgi:hypothetical protein